MFAQYLELGDSSKMESLMLAMVASKLRNTLTFRQMKVSKLIIVIGLSFNSASYIVYMDVYQGKPKWLHIKRAKFKMSRSPTV